MPALRMDAKAVSNFLEETIGVGAPVYDYGYEEICLAVYESALRTVIAAQGVPSDHRDPACAVLEWEDWGKSDVAMRAWAMCRAMDRILDVEHHRYPSVFRANLIDMTYAELGK